MVAMFAVVLAEEGYMPVAHLQKTHVVRNGILAGVVAAAVPAHGFIVGNKGLVARTATKISESPIVGWLRTFLGACVWAAMMAAGMLVYQHFVTKWEERGFPLLPVAALTAVSQDHTKSRGPIPLSSLSQSTASESKGGTQTSFLDMYEG